MEKIKVGIFGTRRGMDYAREFLLLGCEIVAICEAREAVRNAVAKELGEGVCAYADFDEFIEHDMDAVVIANNFHEHAPYVLRCFERGIHVFSECISNGTMAEGVELARAAEKTNSIYMLAENYPQMPFNREMKKVCDSGTLGKILYAEGEYNHSVSPNDVDFFRMHKYSAKHWRNLLPSTYYITHSLGPLMRVTGAVPKRVTAFAVFAPVGRDVPDASHVGDRAAIITMLNDDGSVFRVTGCSKFGGRYNSYRICGTDGQIENVRGMGNKVMLQYNPWSVPEGKAEIQLYEPGINDKDEALIKKSGHSGGDFITARMFVDCIREGKQPEAPFDVYSAITMSSVAILAMRSVLEGGKPYDIPDFRLEEDCKKYENDRLSPFYGMDGSEPTMPCCSHPDYKPTDEQVSAYLKALEGKIDGEQ